MFLKTFPMHFSSYAIRSPFDLTLFKSPNSLNLVRKSLSARYRDPQLAESIAQQLQCYKKKMYDFEMVCKQINKYQKIVKGDVKGQTKLGENGQFDNNRKTTIQEMTEMKSKQKTMTIEIKSMLKSLQQQIMKVGNIVDEATPISKNETDNQILKQYKPSQLNTTHTTPYSQLCEKFGLTDLKRGQKVGGHRGYFLKGKGVKLALGIANYGLNFLEKKGYELFYSPAIINEVTLRGSCQLQSIEEDVYKLQKLQSYLIATSEQSLAGYYRDELIPKTKMPIRMSGFSTCFRKQAGAHGKDIHGLFRVHQFEKVEQFSIVKPEDSRREMKNMMEISEEFYQLLGIPYRVVNIVSGELNDAAACKYDLQAWYPSQQRYRELVSVSNCTEYQSRLLKIQYLGENNDLVYPHMLNGTLVAVQRALTCMVENWFIGGVIKIPEVLWGYVGCEEIRLSEGKQ